MTGIQLSDLLALAKAATKGPYEGSGDGRHLYAEGDGPDEIATFWGNLPADTDYAAAAMNSVPELIKMIRELQNES